MTEPENHTLGPIASEYEHGHCHDLDCCPGSYRYFASCSCGNVYDESNEGDVEWEHGLHVKSMEPK